MIKYSCRTEDDGTDFVNIFVCCYKENLYYDSSSDSDTNSANVATSSSATVTTRYFFGFELSISIKILLNVLIC